MFKATGTDDVPGTASEILVNRTELMLQSELPVLAIRIAWIPEVAKPPVTVTVTQSYQPPLGTEALASVCVPSAFWISRVAVCPEPLATRRSMEYVPVEGTSTVYFIHSVGLKKHTL